MPITAARTSRPESALAALTANEKATVFDELLAIRPDLRELAETHASRLIMNEDRSAVAGDVEYALLSRSIEELNSRAGYQPGQGYVHPGEAADEILDEELESFRHDLERRARLGMGTAAVELAADRRRPHILPGRSTDGPWFVPGPQGVCGRGAPNASRRGAWFARLARRAAATMVKSWRSHLQTLWLEATTGPASV